MYKYTGQERDASTGLAFYQARYYDLPLGRFVSPDPIVPNFVDPQAFNRYAYARNNPVRYTDPTGHWWDDRPGDDWPGDDWPGGGGGPGEGYIDPSTGVYTIPILVVGTPLPPESLFSTPFPDPWGLDSLLNLLVSPVYGFPFGITPGGSDEGTGPLIPKSQFKGFENGYCINQGCNLVVTFKPTAPQITPNVGINDPYWVEGTVQRTPGASIWGGVVVTGLTNKGVPVEIFGIQPNTPLAPPFSFKGAVSGGSTSYFRFTVMDIHGRSYGEQTRGVNYGDVPLF